MTAAIAEVPKAKTAAAAPPQFAPSQLMEHEIPLGLIVRSETNRVPTVDESFIESIRRSGVRDAILVRPIKATQEHLEGWRRIDAPPISLGQTIYKLVYGERRWIASEKAGRKTIPAKIRELTDTQALEIQISENEHREDYSVMDRAGAYGRLREQYMKDHHGVKGWTEEKCMDLIAVNCKNEKIKGRTVQQVISLWLRLHGFVQAALRQGEMEASHGYEIARRPEEEQLTLLKWLRTETQHGQGDIPSVRRLKREIVEMDRLADERRRQEKLFEAATKGPEVEFDGKKIELFPGPLPTSIKRALVKPYGAELTTAYFCKDERIQLAIGLTGKPFYLTVSELQNVLTTGIPYAIAVQTSAAKEPDWINKKAPVIQPAKPLSQKQIKKFADEQSRQNEQRLKSERERERNARIEKKHRGLVFAAFARKATINSRFLSHAVPDMVFSSLDGNTYDEFEIDAEFGQRSLGWPAPSDGNAYSVEEICNHAKKHTRKFTQGLLAAVILTIHMTPAVSQQLSKYFGVDVKKLRQKATATVKEEEVKARLPKEPKTNHEKQLLASLYGYAASSKKWDEIRKKGVTDQELYRAIRANMSTGGKAGPDWGPVSCSSKVPAVWFDAVNSSGKPSLQGPALLTAVRAVLNIPEKGAKA